VPPALVVGLPVGFVNAAESKALLLECDVPYITNVGRKGGSNVAAAVVNALIILAGEEAMNLCLFAKMQPLKRNSAGRLQPQPIKQATP
jgi:hypothetical protein